MKALILIFCIISGQAFSAQQKINYQDELLIEGEVDELENVKADEELNLYRKELGNVQDLYQGYKAKKRVLKKLKGYAEKLSGEYQDFIAEKNSYEKEITQFNNQMKCVTNPSLPECLAQSPLAGYGKQIQATLSKYNPYFQRCLSKNKSNKKGVEGLVSHITVNGQGKLSDIGWEHSPEFKNNNLLNCFGTLISKINFPPTPNGELVKVKQPMNLKLN